MANVGLNVEVIIKKIIMFLFSLDYIYFNPGGAGGGIENQRFRKNIPMFQIWEK